MTSQSFAPPPSGQTKQSLTTRFGYFLKSLRIGTKLNIGFGILVALTLLSAGVSYLGSDRATTQINRTDDVRVPMALVASTAQADLLRMLGDVRGYLALGDQAYRDSYNQSNQAFQADLAELESLLALSADPLSQSRLTELKTAYAQWSQLPDRLFELRNDQLDREPAYRILATDGVKLAGQVLIGINSMIGNQGLLEPSADNQARLQEMAQFQGTFAAMLSALRGYVTTRNRIFRQEYDVNLAANSQVWDRLQSKRGTLPASQVKLLDSVAQNREAFLQLPGQIFAILESDRWREDLYLFRTEAVPLAETMQNLLDKVTNDQQTLLKTELASGRQDLINANQIILGGGIFALLVGITMAYSARATIARPVRRLTRVAERIRAGDLEAQASVESGDEIGILAGTFNRMTSQLRQTLLQVRKEKKRADDLLEVVIPIGVELASEKDYNRLLEKMLLEAKSFCHASAGVLYLRTADDHLKYVILREDTQPIALGGTTGQEITAKPVPLYDKATGAPNERNLAALVALHGASLSVTNEDQITSYDLPVIGDSQQRLVQTPISCLAIPLKNSANQVLGVMQLINAQDPESGHFIPFDQNLQRMMESFSSLAVAALEAYTREQNLRQQIQQLRIEIDEVKRQKQVSEIVESDFFQHLQNRARALRERGQTG